MKKYEEILKTVQDILEDEETIDSIMKQYNKKTETKEEYKVNRKKRILQLLTIAEYQKMITLRLSVGPEQDTQYT